MWYTALIIVHIVSCFFLVAVVLLQTGKGSDIGAVFGGSSQTIFGSSGAGNLLTKLTTATAVVFMLTSLTLTYGTTRQTPQSVFDNAPVSAPVPTAPENPPTAQSQESSQNPATAPLPAGEPARPAHESAQPAPMTSESTAAPSAANPSATKE